MVWHLFFNGPFIYLLRFKFFFDVNFKHTQKKK